MIAHNLKTKDIIKALRRIKSEYVDAFVEDELTLVFKPSEINDEDEGEIDIQDTIV